MNKESKIHEYGRVLSALLTFVALVFSSGCALTKQAKCDEYIDSLAYGLPSPEEQEWYRENCQ